MGAHVQKFTNLVKVKKYVIYTNGANGRWTEYNIRGKEYRLGRPAAPPSGTLATNAIWCFIKSIVRFL